MSRRARTFDVSSLDLSRVLTRDKWMELVRLLELSPGQADFLWNAFSDPRDRSIAQRMGLSQHGAHAHRMSLFGKLDVDSMPAAFARVFAAYVHLGCSRNGAEGRVPPEPERVVSENLLT